MTAIATINTRADAQTAADFLVRCALGKMYQHFVFAWCQKMMTRKVGRISLFTTLAERGDGAANARND